MKKHFTEPEIEVIKFQEEDIITTSGSTSGSTSTEGEHEDGGDIPLE